MEQIPRAWNDFFDELVQSICYCGDQKRPGDPFCRFCYKVLPKHLQRRIYHSRVSRAYAEAREECGSYLEAHPR